MKRYFSLTLRVLLAVAGISYILLNVDWHDNVEVRKGTFLSDGQVVEQDKLRLKVVAGVMNPRQQQESLTLANPEASHPQPIVVTPAELADANHFLLRPSLKTTLRYANFWLLLLGILLIAPVFPIQAYRWLLLLRARGLEVSYARAMKLLMIGSFFNYCMPGSTGGDVIKAYYSAKNSDRRADSVMTVIIDRVVGLVALMILAGVVGLFILHEPLARKITINLWRGMALACILAMIYFSRRMRRWLALERLLKIVPAGAFLAKVDRATMAYHDHKAVILWTVLMSIPVHLLLVASTAIAGYALGMRPTSPGLLLTVIPVIFLTGAVPITPQGAGVWELLGKTMLLHPPYVTMNQIVGMLFMIRFYQLMYSLTGAIYLLRGDVHLHPDKYPVADETTPINA